MIADLSGITILIKMLTLYIYLIIFYKPQKSSKHLAYIEWRTANSAENIAWVNIKCPLMRGIWHDA